MKQSLDAKLHQKHVEVMITFNMINVHIIALQQDGCLHWHIMLYSSVLSPELLEKVAAASSMVLQSQISKMLDSITCTTDHVTFINGTMIYFLQSNMVVDVLEVLI